MRRKHLDIRTVGGLLTMVVISICSAALPGTPGHARAQDASAVVAVVVPSDSLPKSDDEFDVGISVENVSQLAAFQVALSFNSDVLQALSIKKMEFLGSTGREVQCNEPTVEDAAVRLSCVTLRRTPNPPDGSGTLATVTFKPRGSGRSDLALSQVTLALPDGTQIPATTRDAAITVTGGGGRSRTAIFVFIGVALAVAAVIVTGSMMVWRRRGRRERSV
jgi:hypothetical protein